MREITCPGYQVKQHPTTGVWVRDDGAVWMRIGSTDKFRWTYGHKAPNGYMRLFIHKKNYSVHRLVAEAFIENLDQKPTVDHVNRVRDDNRLFNLRWATHKEQNENCITALNRVDYGVRKCDDIKAYRKAYRQSHQEYFREWERAHKGRKHRRAV